MIRITADLDNTKVSIARARAYIISAFLIRQFNYPVSDVLVRKSSSGKGCHVILWIDTNDTKLLTKSRIFYIRELLGDDYKRVKLDRLRKFPEQRLFKKKIKLKKKYNVHSKI